MKHVLFTVLLFATPLALNVARADIVTFETVINAEPPEEFVNAIPKFDPSLGTLEMITLGFSEGSGFIDGVVVDDDNSGGGTVSGFVDVSFCFIFPDHPDVDVFGSAVFTGTQDYSVAVGGTSPIQVVVMGAGPEVVIGDPTELAAFIAAFPDETALLISIFDFPMFDGGPDTAFAELSVLSATFSVTYTFSPVPEPATGSVLSLIAIGLGLIRHRRS